MIYHYPPVISPSSTINEEPPIDDLIHDLDLINDSLSHLLLFCCNLCVTCSCFIPIEVKRSPLRALYEVVFRWLDHVISIVSSQRKRLFHQLKWI